MATKILNVRITGIMPLIVHNGALADPLYPISKAIKKISGKRSKTDADYEEMARLEWLGSLYLDDEGPVMPGVCIEALIINAAKKSKQGPLAKAGIIANDDFPIIYDGPRDPDKLYEKKEFVHKAGVRVNNSRVIRTRPIFKHWAIDLKLEYNDQMVDEADVRKFLEVGGDQLGLCEWRPKYGRFRVE